MTTRIIRITKCAECPKRTLTYHVMSLKLAGLWCSAALQEIDRSDEIPDWCPLESEKEPEK